MKPCRHDAVRLVSKNSHRELVCVDCGKVVRVGRSTITGKQ